MTNKTFEKYSQISAMMHELSQEVAPLSERFYKFIQETNTAGYVSCELDDRGAVGTVDFSEFEIYFDRTGQEDLSKGVSFFSEQYDWDIMISLGFTVPHDYFSDPDKWEQDLMARIAFDRANVLKAINQFYPGLLRPTEEPIVQVYSMEYMDHPDLLGVSLENVSASNGRTITYGDKTFPCFESFFYKPSTGEIFESGPKVGIYNVANGEVPAAGVIEL